MSLEANLKSSRPAAGLNRHGQPKQTPLVRDESYGLLNQRKCRQVLANARRIAHEHVTPEMQLAHLDEVFGKDKGAARERARLKKKIEAREARVVSRVVAVDPGNTVGAVDTSVSAMTGRLTKKNASRAGKA